MGDLTDKEASSVIRIVGGDEVYAADVQLIDGAPSLRTFGIQAIESLRGFDPIADTWFYFGTEEDSSGAGDIGDTVRVRIAASLDNPTDFPAVDLTYVLVAEDVGDEEKLAANVTSYLNSEISFSTLWRAQRIPNSGAVYVTAKKPGSIFERPNLNDFRVDTTGTTIVTVAFDKIVRRNKITSLARDPADPRQGILGIQGTVVQTEGDLTGRFQTVFPTLNINGSVTPVNFRIEAHPTEVVFISSIDFAGQDTNIKFGQFLGEAAKPNGIQVTFKSNNFMVTREPIKTTDDFLDFHAEIPANFVLYSASGGDKFTAVLVFGSPIELRPQGEFAIDDYLQISIRDNLTGITSLRAIVNGFNREF